MIPKIASYLVLPMFVFFFAISGCEIGSHEPSGLLSRSDFNVDELLQSGYQFSDFDDFPSDLTKPQADRITELFADEVQLKYLFNKKGDTTSLIQFWGAKEPRWHELIIFYPSTESRESAFSELLEWGNKRFTLGDTLKTSDQFDYVFKVLVRDNVLNMYKVIMKSERDSAIRIIHPI